MLELSQSCWICVRVSVRCSSGRAGLVQEHKAARIHEALPDPKAAAFLSDIRPSRIGRPERLFVRQAHALEHEMDRREGLHLDSAGAQFGLDLGQCDAGLSRIRERSRS